MFARTPLLVLVFALAGAHAACSAESASDEPAAAAGPAAGPAGARSPLANPAPPADAATGDAATPAAARFDLGANAGDPTWSNAQNALAQRLAQQPNTNRAKNVILFVADGMGVSTVTAGRIHVGQKLGGPGEDHVLSFEAMPHAALVKTYNLDAQVPDSAGTATAMMTGLKTRIGAIGLRADQARQGCAENANDLPRTLGELAEEAGLATGIVSTARITHATPAAVYAHAPNRNWESDADLPSSALETGCTDIASQMIGFAFGDGLDVMLGGGRQMFLPAGEGGKRRDGQDLTELWRDGPAARLYVEDAAGLASAAGTSDQVLGLFASSHMDYEADRDPASQPSLADMTRFAIDRLSQSESGFFLMVESGRIDHAHHAANAARALEDLAAFDAAVAAALEIVDLDETLVLVTADHDHTFVISGYPARGNPILGLVHPVDRFTGERSAETMPAGDGKPYATLGYYNGPNLRGADEPPLTEEQAQGIDFIQEAAVPMMSETHAGHDVPLYAAGPWAHLASGTIEQNFVFHMIAHAYGWEGLEGGD